MDTSENHEPSHEQAFYTLREAAKILLMTERTMRKLLTNKDIFGHKLGGQWRVPRAEIERLKMLPQQS